jgi:hypothetical protein
MHGKDLTLVSGLTNSNYNADPPERTGGPARVRMGGAAEFGRRSQDVPRFQWDDARHPLSSLQLLKIVDRTSNKGD